MPDWLSKINIFKSQKCAGIHVNILSDSELDISCVILRNKKSILEIEESYYGIKNINELEEFLNPNIPVILSIGGKGIIHKTIQVNNGITGWEQAFPNIKMDEFNSQSFPVSEENSIFSIIRKETLNQLIETIKELKIFILDIFLGPVTINYLISNITGVPDKLSIPHFILDIKDNSLVNFKFNGNNQDIEESIYAGGEKIDTRIAIAYSNALSYYIENEEIEKDFDVINNEKGEFLYKQIFNKAGIASLVTLFMILLINYVLFDQYGKKFDRLNLELRHNEELINRLSKLREEYKVKEEIILNSGLVKSTRWSFYSDRVALLLPSTITLTGLNVNPLAKSIDPDNEVIFNKNIVEISGITKSSIYLDSWIKKLNREKWVKDIEIMNFSQENITTPAEFTIELSIDGEADKP